MATIITYPSALEYWLSNNGIPYHFHFDKDSSTAATHKVLRSTSSSKDIIYSVDQLNFSFPVHVAVSEHTNRARKETVIFHKLPEQLPDNSFYTISEDLYIASPELCFVLAAHDRSIPELVLLANELCAIYIKDDLEEFGQRKRNPVTTTASIKAFINKVTQVYGIQKARTAIKYALDRSNSPMESRLAVLATLPLSRGGFGLIKPQLNLEIRLPKVAAEYLGRASCCCDMVWKKQKVILEYDSNLSHLEIRQHFTDKKRATALTIAGYKVASITAEQLRNFSSIETTFLRVREMLDMRTYKERLENYFEQRWNVVHTILLHKKETLVSTYPQR